MDLTIEFYATVTGAIILFLYSIRKLSEIFEQLFTNKAKQILRNYTSSLPTAILVGAATTLILDSSSAVIILTLVFINAGTIDLRRGIGIALGANIGTTLQSQLFAFDVMAYSFILLLIGISHLFVKNDKVYKYLKLIFFLGILFYALFLIEEAVARPEIFSQISSWLEHNAVSPFRTALAGGLFTVIIQSSGAMVGIVIGLAKEGLFDPSLGIAVMMGAELGTCANILVASIAAKREALYLAIFNILFNLISISLGLVFFEQFVDLIDYFFSSLSVSRQIANAHILFNVLGVILIFFFVDPYLRIIKRFGY